MKLFYVLCIALCANNISAQQPDEAATKQLELFRITYAEWMDGKKGTDLSPFYANQLRLMPEFQKTIMKQENAALYYKAFFNRFEVTQYNRTATERIDLGTRVIEIGSFTCSLTLKESKDQQPLKGKYMDVWQRENGNLKLTTQAWNYDHSLPWENQLKFDEVPFVNVALQAHVPINNAVAFELAALDRLMERVVSEHDDKLWVQFYADDGNFMYSRHAVASGKKELTAFLEQHVKELVIFEKLDIRNDQIDDLGKYVIGYASHIAIIRSGDFSGVFTGKDLALWRREPNGSLKIFRHIGMYD